jgi:RNA 2',3'-cyclic 3'-phosphodiesterase
MPRLFVAVEIPQAVKDQVLALRQGHDLSIARWVSPDQYHITLHFLGEVPAAPVRQALAAVEADAFSLRLQGLGQFPVAGRAKSVWAGVTSAPELRALHERTAEALRPTGYRPAMERFHPHVTLARLSKPPRRGLVDPFLDAHRDFLSDAFDVDAFALVASRLTPQGPVYTIDARYPLRSR